MKAYLVAAEEQQEGDVAVLLEQMEEQLVLHRQL
jgi:hypothetical protein